MALDVHRQLPENDAAVAPGLVGHARSASLEQVIDS
jgi:hypothetical protein